MQLNYYREEAYSPHSDPELESMRKRAMDARKAYADYRAANAGTLSAAQSAELNKLQGLMAHADSTYLSNQQTHYRYGKPAPKKPADPYGDQVRGLLR